MAYPKYIDYGNDIVLPLPGLSKYAKLYSFIIRGDLEAMQKMVDDRLNFAPDTQTKKYFVLVDEIFLVFSQFPFGESQDTEVPPKGIIEETAVQTFLRLAECTQDSNGEWVAQRQVFFCPYIMVDNVFSVVAGREQFGFPKSLGIFEIPTTPEFAQQFNVTAYSFKNFGPREVSCLNNFMRVERVDNLDENDEIESWGSGKSAWGAIKQLFSEPDTEIKKSWKFYVSELEDIFKMEVPLVFLKQFRDIADPNTACYQAIVGGDADVKKFRGGWFLPGTYKVFLEDVDSFPIQKDLGLTDEVEVLFAFWSEIDIYFGTGEEIWKA